MDKAEFVAYAIKYINPYTEIEISWHGNKDGTMAWHASGILAHQPLNKGGSDYAPIEVTHLIKNTVSLAEGDVRRTRPLADDI